MRIRTAAGAWTRKQLTALGVPWPPVKGWPKRFRGGAMIPVSAWEVAAQDTGKICSAKARARAARDQPALNLD